MKEEKILRLREIYNDFLKVEEIKKGCEENYFLSIGYEWGDKCNNPFYINWDFDKVIKDIRDKTIEEIIKIFNEEYPNIELNILDFQDFIVKKHNKEYDRDEETNILNFDGIIRHLKQLEIKKEELATDYLNRMVINVIPHKLRRDENYRERKFLANELVNGNKLILVCYSNSNMEYILKIINIALMNVNPSVAEEYKEVKIKKYKNNRLDISFKYKDDVLKVAKYLEKNQK